MQSRAMNTLFVRYYAFSIAMCFFFSQYDFFVNGFSIAEFLLLSACVPMVLFSRRIGTKFSGNILLYYFISIILSLISVILLGRDYHMVPFWKMLTRWIRYGAYAFLIVLVSDNCIFEANEENLILKIYYFFSYAFGIYAIIQAMVYLLFHYMLPINILPIAWSRTTDTESIASFAQRHYFRGFGPFQEPSYLSKFLLPGLAFSLFGWPHLTKKKTDWKLVVIIVTAIIFSTSVQGILVVAATLFVYIATYKGISGTRKVLFTIVIGVLFVVLLTSSVSTTSLYRITAVFTGQSVGYSSNLRLFRGFAFWNEMPILYKFIGIGMGNMANYAYDYNITTSFDFPDRTAPYLEYGSGISLILVQSGLIGFVIIISWFLKCIKRLNLTGRTMLLQLFLILLSGSGLLSISSIMYFSLIFQNTKELEEHNITKELEEHNNTKELEEFNE